MFAAAVFVTLVLLGGFVVHRAVRSARNRRDHTDDIYPTW